MERSVAEQNSLDLAWALLQKKKYRHLRSCIGGKDLREERRFRELVTNSVMSTDLGDKELKKLRDNRWKKAFSHKDDDVLVSAGKSADNHDDFLESVSRKATIIVEHLMQASDVAHTMQHWEIYREWNENLFNEMYAAYRMGRSDTDPSSFWYDGELGFFDFYIVPLSKKLDECGVFGISSDENLNYALANRVSVF